MSHWKTGIRVKIKRAEQHIHDLERRRVRAFKRDPYVLTAEDKPEDGWLWYCWCKTRRVPVPPMWGAITADIINNLRSALDIMWKQATTPTARKAAFPLATADELKSRMNAAKQPAIKTAFRLALTAEVFQGGKNDLWALHDAWTTDKHEMPLIVACAFTKGFMSTSEVGDDVFITNFRMNAREPAIVEDGKRFMSLRGDRQLHDERQFSFDIAFGQGTALQGMQVTRVLSHFAGITKGLAERFFSAKLIR